jgi:replication-associated recombination protein RarA
LHQERAVISHVQDLFEEAQEIETANTATPVATWVRPRSLEEFVGQEHILAAGKLLRRATEVDRLLSVIFYGPPGRTRIGGSAGPRGLSD